MARPIKETPVLKGKNAKNFEKAIKQNEKRKVSQDKYQRAIAAFKRITVVTDNRV